MVGSTLAHYRIEALLGQGGMGAVYRAYDTRLHRTVALKVLSTAQPDDDAAARVLREARAASALAHPHIVTIHAVERDRDVDFIVMEFVDGTSLAELIPPDGLPVDRAIGYALQVADAVGAAHAAGVVHRDIKPANVIVTRSGAVKVLDFGIARRTALPDDVTRQLTDEGMATRPGDIVGTVGYLSPEQIAGRTADPRSDVFSIGVLLYEMLTGRPPFAGDSTWSVIDATMRAKPPSLRIKRPDAPAAVQRVLDRCLAKQPEHRYASATELAGDLRALTPRQSPRRRAPLSWGIAAALIVAGSSAAAVILMRVRESRVEEARTMLPEMVRLEDAGDVIKAYRVGRAALARAPEDAQVIGAFNAHTAPVPVESTPAGADVAIRAYAANDEGWIPLGRTPTSVRVPIGQVRWRLTKDGYEPLEVSPTTEYVTFALPPAASVPEGMVYVAHGTFRLESTGKDVELPDYYIDKFEVTNREYKAFVDAGAYTTPRYWTQPFVKDGRALEWKEAMHAFRDATGRPGPSTWELGTYPDGEDDFPVNGVSWYEAVAYAQWAHQTLPTAYHWYHASGAVGGIFSSILNFSNFSGKGTVKVGSSGGLGPYGTYDMAGNVKEWCWNATARGWRYILGGAYNEANYKFRDEDAEAPFDRGAGLGFRCMRQKAPLDPTLVAPIDTMKRGVAVTPVSDDIFAIYRRLYDYDPIPLDARLEEVDDSSPLWRRERVSFRAAYGDERVPAYMYLPRSAGPPYQTLVFFPASDAVTKRPSREASIRWLEYLIRSGRAVIYPVYQDTYERYIAPTQGPNQNFLRGMLIQRALDLRRAIDYLETRKDVDGSRLGFYGMSLGAQLAPIFLAIEPERLKAAVLVSGGFEAWGVPPEVDPATFAPRVHQPVLMVNGREDFDLPYDTSQVPMFKALGTSPADKRHVAFDGGHIPPRPLEIYAAVLDWYDKYLGPTHRGLTSAR